MYIFNYICIYLLYTYMCVCACVQQFMFRLIRPPPSGISQRGFHWRNSLLRRLRPALHMYLCVCVCVCVQPVLFRLIHPPPVSHSAAFTGDALFCV